MTRGHPEDPAGSFGKSGHWQQNVETLWQDYGCARFVEVGPKNTLCNLIVDTFENVRCIHTSLPENEAYAFRAAAAQLYARVTSIPRSRQLK